MLGTLLLSIVAGYLVTRVEPHLDKFLVGALPPEIKLDQGDLRVVTLVVMATLVAILVLLMNADSSLFMGAIGLFGGFFGTRIIAFFRDPDSVAPPAWDADEVPEDDEIPELPDSTFDIDMETLRAVRSKIDGDKRS